jgi:Holliday junction resolvase
MESVFSRAYSYRERKHKNNLENYLIEIFSFCLGDDLQFRKKFLELINVPVEDGKYLIKTQATYGNLRPDIVIESDSTFIIIECKIEASERLNQLNDYAKIVQRETKRNKKLIYLTKFYQYKEITDLLVDYQNIRWMNISDIISSEMSKTITKELHKFINERKIAMKTEITTQDLVALDLIPDSISKMDEIIESVKENFEKKIGNLSKPSSRSTWLQKKAYFNNYKVNSQMAIDLGFMWWWNDGRIYLTVRIYLPKSDLRFDDKKIFLQGNLKDWDKKEGEAFIIGKYLNVNKIVAEKTDQVEEMINFLNENIDVLHKLKEEKPEFFQ